MTRRRSIRTNLLGGPCHLMSLGSTPGCRTGPHMTGGLPISLADPMYIAAGDLKATVAHPLANSRGGGHRAKLRSHEVPEPIQP